MKTAPWAGFITKVHGSRHAAPDDRSHP